MIVVTASCRGCGACLLTCPERAIRPAHREHAVRREHAGTPGAVPLAVLADRCTGCGECVEVCPADAIGLPGSGAAAAAGVAAGRRATRATREVR